MKKQEFIRLYGKENYLQVIEGNKMRNRRNRGYQGDNRGSWKRGVIEELLGEGEDK